MRAGKRTRRLGAVTLTAAVVAVVAGAGGATPALAVAETGLSSFYRQTIDWVPCAEDPTAQCGTLTVPIDWTKPGGPTFELALARRTAGEPSARIGSLVINPGGPGGSGVEAVLGASDYFSSELTRQFDLVGFDPRGVGGSHPILCSTELMRSQPSPVLTSQAGFDALVNFNRRLAEDCRQRTGPLYDQVDTLGVVRDLDVLRAALGEAKLTYYGLSYGTLIGQQYAELFGKRIRAAVIDSTMDHSLGTEGLFRTETIAAQDSFDEFVAWCERTETCPLREAGAREVFADLRARADRSELIIPELPDLKIDSFLLRAIATDAFYGPDWFELAEILAALDAGRLPENATRSAALSPGALGLLARYQPLDGDGVPEAIANSMPVFCEDWSVPIRDYQEYAGIVDRMWAIAPDLGPSPIALRMAMGCTGWPGTVNNPQHRLHARNQTSLLMLNALYDPATAYAWATNAARQLGRRAVLVTYEGWGHGVYGRGPCADALVDGYLTRVEVPERPVTCPAIEPEPGTGGEETPTTRSLAPGKDPSRSAAIRPGSLPFGG